VTGAIILRSNADICAFCLVPI